MTKREVSSLLRMRIPIHALLTLDGWHGRSEQECIVFGETPKRYRITSYRRIKLAGRNRWMEAGGTALAPKHSIKFKP